MAATTLPVFASGPVPLGYIRCLHPLLPGQLSIIVHAQGWTCILLISLMGMNRDTARGQLITAIDSVRLVPPSALLFLPAPPS